MKLNYILFAPYPNERAYSVQITEFTGALRRLGVEVKVHGFKKRISFNSKIAAYLSFRIKCVLLIARLLLKDDINGSWIFMRDPSYVRLIKKIFPKSKIILEIHYLTKQQQDKSFLRSLSKNTEKIIFLTEIARSKFKLDESYTLHDGTSCERCLTKKEKKNSTNYDEIIKDLKLCENSIKIGYFGSFSTLNQSKGVKEFVQLHYGDPTLLTLKFYFIGGTTKEVNELNKKYFGNFRFFERVTYSEARFLMRKFDCLLLLETQSDFSNTFSSPLKLFDYLRMNKPIVCTRLTPILEVVGENTNGIHFVNLGDAFKIKDAIENSMVIEPGELQLDEVANAFCWCVRARTIINWMESK